jgi:hypothetical protein
MAGLEPFGRVLIIGGVITTLIGVLMVFGDRIPFLFKLPGDIVIQRENGTIFIPLGTMLVVSLVVSVILGLLNRR